MPDQKPTEFYHASPNGDIAEFVPLAESMRDPAEGPQVFATPSRAMATIFLVKTDDSWANSGSIDDVPYMIISDEARYRAADTGGYVYTLPPESFVNDPKKGLGPLEWTSSVKVIPAKKEFYPSAVEAMIDAGVQVYFTDLEAYRKIQNDIDHISEYLYALESENRRRNKNVAKPFGI
jgi:hypothetical protein